jgi:hypothetical protein
VRVERVLVEAAVVAGQVVEHLVGARTHDVQPAVAARRVEVARQHVDGLDQRQCDLAGGLVLVGVAGRAGRGQRGELVAALDRLGQVDLFLAHAPQQGRRFHLAGRFVDLVAHVGLLRAICAVSGAAIAIGQRASLRSGSAPICSLTSLVRRLR